MADQRELWTATHSSPLPGSSELAKGDASMAEATGRRRSDEAGDAPTAQVSSEQAQTTVALQQHLQNLAAIQQRLQQQQQHHGQPQPTLGPVMRGVLSAAAAAASIAAASAAASAQQQQHHQQRDHQQHQLLPAPGMQPATVQPLHQQGRRFFKHHQTRMQTAASHILFYLVDADQLAHLAVVVSEKPRQFGKRGISSLPCHLPPRCYPHAGHRHSGHGPFHLLLHPRLSP
jgi:hypothetical protein